MLNILEKHHLQTTRYWRIFDPGRFYETVKLLAMLCCALAPLFAQIAPASASLPSFEAATVRLSPPDCMSLPRLGLGPSVTGGHFSAKCETLKSVIMAAYNVRRDQVVGPDWLETVRIDVEAKMAEGAVESQVFGMLQALLADRLKMTTHAGTRERPIYELTVSKGGLKMSRETGIAESELRPPPGSETVGMPGSQTTMNGSALIGQGVKAIKDQNGTHFEMSRTSALLPVLAEFLGRPVEDRTGLQGAYAIRLDISGPELMRVMRASATDPGESAAFFQDQLDKLGLKLSSTKGQAETIEVDHIERVPSEN